MKNDSKIRHNRTKTTSDLNGLYCIGYTALFIQVASIQKHIIGKLCEILWTYELTWLARALWFDDLFALRYMSLTAEPLSCFSLNYFLKLDSNQSNDSNDGLFMGGVVYKLQSEQQGATLVYQD